MRSSGIFTVSLDFELYWGVRDLLSLEEYGANILAVHEVVPRLLDLFRRYEIHATWAVVGFLYFRDVAELLRRVPKALPAYEERRFDPYAALPALAADAVDPRYYFAPELIAAIAATPHQELASHTFSHYYCLESGQTLREFRADLEAAIAVAVEKTGRRPLSIVFPRNQYRRDYLQVCAAAGIRAYRGNPRSWVWHPSVLKRDGALRRAVRLLDAYINLTGHHGHRLERMRPRGGLPANIAASQFLRPWSRSWRWLEPLKERRIRQSLTWCAKRKLVYHLWWHPHNFGADIDENVGQLRRILEHFARLRDRYGMRSLTMAETADYADRELGR
jgi:peptidoglycan/xylan/chitin deacetylase (PgdA/CDA1 family)